MQIYKQDFEVEYKKDSSPLTLADKKANDIIEDGLNRLSVNFPILSEEGKEIPYEDRKHWEYFWLIDPLDGTKEFVKKNGEFTVNIALIHNDSPIVPPNMMRLLSIAVNRETRSGHILGPDQKISVMDALNSITLGAAYQYFEEDQKGSIIAGKRADFVILEENPLEVDPSRLQDIAIVETFSRGKSVYQR